MSDQNGDITIPKGWTITTTEDVAEILDHKRKPVNSKERAARIAGKKPEELFPYFGATGQVGFIDDFLIEGSFVLLGEDGAPFLDHKKDTAYLVNGKIWVNNHAHILKSHFSNKFLCFYLNQVDYRRFVTGTTRLKLNQSAMRKIPFPLPPLPEQHRIVAKIEELFSHLDAGIAQLKKVQQQLKTYRQSVLKWAFEGRLTEEWRKQQVEQSEMLTGAERNVSMSAEALLEQIQEGRQAHYQKQLEEWEVAVKSWEEEGKPGRKPKKPKKLKEYQPLTEGELTELPELPEGWMWVRLGNLSRNIQVGPFGSQLHKEDYIIGGIPLINPKNIRSQKIYPDQRISISQEIASALPQYVLTINDVIMGRRGEMGRTAPITNKEDGWFCGTGSLFIRFTKLSIPTFYSLFMAGQRTKKYLEDNSIGTTMKNLNSTVLNNTPVPLVQHQEQLQILKEIESRLSQSDRLEETIEKALQQSKALRQSILKRAFEGKLVPQDPNDESATVLLDRIKKEKELAKNVQNSPSDLSATSPKGGQ